MQDINILATEIKTYLDQGLKPDQIVKDYMNKGVSEEELKEAFTKLGATQDDLSSMFQNTEAQGMYQNGGLVIPSTINQYMSLVEDGYRKDPTANYLPLDLNSKGSPIGAAMMFADIAGDLFSGKQNPETGLKQGFFRDAKIKKALQREKAPDYYNYKIMKDSQDPNDYMYDNRDLYDAATKNKFLRTEEQFKRDLNDNSRVRFNTKTNDYELLYSNRPIQNKNLTAEQKKYVNGFYNEGIKLDEFKNRFDADTANMIKQNNDLGTTGISPTGEAKTYIKDNPYLYETMMGINTLNGFYGNKQYGGSIKKYNPGGEQNPIPFKEWYIQNAVTIGDQNPQALYNDYLNQFMVGPPKQAQQNALSEFTNTAEPKADNSYFTPQVEITNKLQGDFNRLKDSRFTQGFGDLSNMAVQGAGFINEIYKNKKRKSAEADLYKMTQADNMFGYFEDPVNKRGTYDVNTGLLEQNNYVPYMKQGGDFKPHMMYKGDQAVEAKTYKQHIDLQKKGYGHHDPQTELDLDPDTIAKLISAGADLEIL